MFVNVGQELQVNTTNNRSEEDRITQAEKDAQKNKQLMDVSDMCCV